MERKLRFSWILPQKLAVGGRPRSFFELDSLGFAAVLSLQEEDEPGPEDDPPPALSFRRVAIRDGIRGGVPTIPQIQEAVEALRDFLDRGLRTYVHCFAGVGRSPLVCMAYLAKVRGLGLLEAFTKVAAVHSPTCPTEEQLLALQRFLLPGVKDPL